MYDTRMTKGHSDALNAVVQARTNVVFRSAMKAELDLLTRSINDLTNSNIELIHRHMLVGCCLPHPLELGRLLVVPKIRDHLVVISRYRSGDSFTE